MDILWIILGIGLIVCGANMLTDGASAVAKSFNIPDMVIGLTIVAFGTSTPELSVSLLSALKGSSDIAIGNVMGSNIFNALMIVGCTALVAPIAITRNTLTKEIPLCLLSSAVLFILGNDQMIEGLPDKISRTDGLVLLAFFLIFMGYTFSLSSSNAPSSEEEIKTMPLWRSTVYIILGLSFLIFGGQLFVDSSTEMARSLGVSEAVIGLTLVAGGTSLPELATSIVAALKKNPEIAIGNVIGSNLFNAFFILGSSAAIVPMNTVDITRFDWGVLLISSLLLYIVGLFFKKRTITRVEGAILALTYVAYIACLIAK